MRICPIVGLLCAAGPTWQLATAWRASSSSSCVRCCTTLRVSGSSWYVSLLQDGEAPVGCSAGTPLPAGIGVAPPPAATAGCMPLGGMCELRETYSLPHAAASAARRLLHGMVVCRFAAVTDAVNSTQTRLEAATARTSCSNQNVHNEISKTPVAKRM